MPGPRYSRGGPTRRERKANRQAVQPAARSRPATSSITSILGPARTPGTAEYQPELGPRKTLANVGALRAGLPLAFTVDEGGQPRRAPYLNEALESLRSPLPVSNPAAARMAPYAIEAAAETGVPASLLLAVSGQESAFGTNLGPSSAGARGEMQFIPGTRAGMIQKYGKRADPWGGPRKAFRAGALYLKELGVLEDPSNALSRYSGGYAQGVYNNPILESAGEFAPLDKQVRKSARSRQVLAALGLSEGGKAGRGPNGGQSFGPRTQLAGAGTPAGAPRLFKGPRPKLGTIDPGSLTQEQQQVEPITRKLGKVISARVGRPIELISGVRPGDPKEHGHGHALDIHALSERYGDAKTQRQGDEVAKAAIIAGGGTKAEAEDFIKQGGGWINVYGPAGRVQVGWRTDDYGDHHNHVHVGVDPEGDGGATQFSGGGTAGGAGGAAVAGGTGAAPSQQQKQSAPTPAPAPSYLPGRGIAATAALPTDVSSIQAELAAMLSGGGASPASGEATTLSQILNRRRYRPSR